MRAALALVVLLPLALAAESKESSDEQLVIELGNENFTSIVTSAEHAVVVFYIPVRVAARAIVARQSRARL